MARILSISSQVVRGHVGNSSTQFALQCLGHEVWAIPTILLSNHPGHSHFGGAQIKPSYLAPILEALDLNGWLSEVDAVVTGYLPTPEHVVLAKTAVDLVKSQRPDALYLCDPVLGDDGKDLYVSTAAAETLRVELIPAADIATPNRFELEWLMARPVTNEREAAGAARALAPARVLVTSVPADGAHLINLVSEKSALLRTKVPRRTKAPNGTGDFIAAVFLGNLLETQDVGSALSFATGALEELLTASRTQDELALVASVPLWTNPKKWPVEPLKIPA